MKGEERPHVKLPSSSFYAIERQLSKNCLWNVDGICKITPPPQTTIAFRQSTLNTCSKKHFFSSVFDIIYDSNCNHNNAFKWVWKLHIYSKEYIYYFFVGSFYINHCPWILRGVTGTQRLLLCATIILIKRCSPLFAGMSVCFWRSRCDYPFSLSLCFLLWTMKLDWKLGWSPNMVSFLQEHYGEFDVEKQSLFWCKSL